MTATAPWPNSTHSAQQVIERLALIPLEVEGGYWAPLHREDGGNAILFLMTPEGFSAMHRLTVTECWTWLAGEAAEMLQLTDRSQTVRLDASNPATLVTPGTWQGCSTTGAWTLVMCWCVPAFTDECFELGNREMLCAEHPQATLRLQELTR